MLGTCVKISYHSQLIAPLSKQLAQLPASRSTIYARVNFAQSLIEIKEPQVEQFLKDTVRQSQVLEDDIAQAYAIGVLGHWLEIQHKDKQALAFTDRALVLASTANQVKISATLHWQRRRILKKQGNRPQVISAYQSAVTDLENLHQDLVAVNPHLKFSFRYSGRLPMSVLHDGKQFYGRLATILRQNLWTSFIDI